MTGGGLRTPLDRDASQIQWRTCWCVFVNTEWLLLLEPTAQTWRSSQLLNHIWMLINSHRSCVVFLSHISSIPPWSSCLTPSKHKKQTASSSTVHMAPGYTSDMPANTQMPSELWVSGSLSFLILQNKGVCRVFSTSGLAGLVCAVCSWAPVKSTLTCRSWKSGKKGTSDPLFQEPIISELEWKKHNLG